MTLKERNIYILEGLLDVYKASRSTEFTFSLMEHLEILLDELHDEKHFGATGIVDPRGDFEMGSWSMMDIQGIDRA